MRHHRRRERPGDIMDTEVKDAGDIDQRLDRLVERRTGGDLAQAAGVLFVSGGKVLLMQRGAGGDFGGTWAFPGGGIEEGETPAEAAIREVFEETGYQVDDANLLKAHTRRVADGTDFTCFRCDLTLPFEPVLNDEHGAAGWFSPGELPANLHPGVGIALRRLDMTELDVARAIRDGELTSPQRYTAGNAEVWLFDLRITGTGAAYRDSLDEYAWRAPELYLNDDMLERCQGLAVIWQHPEKSMLNTVEYRDRSVGAFMLPYIKAQEVWGIAKIHDGDAAALLERLQLSTSPGVILRGGTPQRFETLEDGTKVLLENAPALLDHLAICEAGVWDKAGPPGGVNISSGDQAVSENTERKVDAADDDADKKVDAAAEEGKADADAGSKPKDAILDALSAISGKLDSVAERQDRLDARMDAAEATKADASKKDNDEEGQGKAAELAADKKDAEGDDDKAEKSDKKDAAEDETAKADSARRDADLAAVKEQLAAVNRRLESADTNEADLTAAQARADSVLSGFGERAPRFLTGEGVLAYRRRLVAPLQKHSAEWKDVDLARMDSVTFEIAERQILDAAGREAANPARHTGSMSMISQTMAGGHTIHEFRGEPRHWMDSIAGVTRNHVTSINTPQ